MVRNACARSAGTRTLRPGRQWAQPNAFGNGRLIELASTRVSALSRYSHRRNVSLRTPCRSANSWCASLTPSPSNSSTSAVQNSRPRRTLGIPPDCLDGRDRHRTGNTERLQRVRRAGDVVAPADSGRPRLCKLPTLRLKTSARPSCVATSGPARSSVRPAQLAHQSQLRPVPRRRSSRRTTRFAHSTTGRFPIRHKLPIFARPRRRF
jgi:hypothetical protein